jgi:hypothetical protein
MQTGSQPQFVNRKRQLIYGYAFGNFQVLKFAGLPGFHGGASHK